MTNHTPATTDSAPRQGRASPKSAHPRTGRGLALLGEILRGILFGGAAFLLGGAPLFFGSAPLGIALLSASSAYTWYIFGGLLLSAFLRPAAPSSWAWVAVYTFCVILRLTIRFFVDPPLFPDGRPCGGRTYLLHCWASFKKNAGLLSDTSTAGDTVTDYYEGSADPSPRRPRADHTPPTDGVNHTTASGENFAPHLFMEHPFLRMLTAAIGGLTAGICATVAGGFHLYDLMGALCSTLIAPAAAFLLISCFSQAGLELLFSPNPPTLPKAGADATEADRRKLKQYPLLPLLSVCLLLTAAVYGARDLTFSLGTPYLVFSTATLLGLILTLLSASRLGVIPGIGIATFCGLAAAPAMAPLFILCAGGYALLRHVSHRVGVIGGCAIAALYCGGVGGVTALLLQLPAILLTVPLFLLTERLWSLLPAARKKPQKAEEMEDISAVLASSLAHRSGEQSRRERLKAMSDAFSSLSKSFYDLSSQLRRPRLLDLRRMCDESFGKHCAHCRNRDACWGTEYERTLEVQARLCAQLHGGGKADARSLPTALRSFCPHMDTLVTDINARCARMTEALLKSEKTEVIAADYAAIAELLNDALEEDRLSAEDYKCNREAADGIYEYLSEVGITVGGVVVCGKKNSRRQKVIVRGEGFDHTPDGLDALRNRIGEICGVPLTPPRFEADDEGGESEVMTLYSDAKMNASYSGSTVPAGADAADAFPPPLTGDTPDGAYEPPAVCGDHIAMFRTDNAYFYALISDGMGSGEDASLTSDICAMFLEKMLSAGNRVEISLRMLDSFVRSKNTGTGEECSATVDLMELDLMDGQAVFAKNGAAPTYVVREGTVYKLHAGTMPLGIIKETSHQLLRFRMHPGDVVVMVSDGITAGNDECPWLVDLLSSPMPENMDSLRRDIIKRALTAGSEDDLSAIAIRVEER